MRARLLFALGFVVLVSALIVARDEGFLGGRELGGPLHLRLPDGAQRVERGQPARFRMGGSLAGSAVRVQNVRPRFASPELAVDARVGGRPLEDSTLAPVDPGSTDDIPAVVFTLRAPRAGLYYAVGMVVDYRRGQRRFRDREPQRLCIAVHTHERCDPNYDGPGEAHVAQVGGPSRYSGARLSEAHALYRAPGSYVAHVTIVNRTRSAIDVSRVGLDRNPAVRLTATAIHLSPRSARGLALHLTAGRCGRGRRFTFDRLRADLDGDRRSIALSLPLAFACG
jgi:hypothetical protein